MIRNRLRTDNRSAFTIIELLVVLMIIVTLAGMLFAGVMKVLGKIPETQTSTEIAEMETGLAGFMADYNLTDPPPSILHLQETGFYNLGNPVELNTVQFLKRWLGQSFNVTAKIDWNGNGFVGDSLVLYGQQCLVFYLGGVPTYSAPGVISGMSGFSPNAVVSPTNIYGPATPAVAGSRRKGPYFNFVPSRLTLFLDNPPAPTVPILFPAYHDPWQVKNPPARGFPHPNGTPYAYFSTQGKINGYSPLDCASFAFPYYEANAAGGLANYTYNNRYQIISAGKDGVFGGQYGTNTALGFAWVSSSGATFYGDDDQANFSTGLLGTGQH
jgi:competence protein ComGC